MAKHTKVLTKLGGEKYRREESRNRKTKGFMFLFTSRNFPDVPGVMAFTGREGGRKAHKLLWGRAVKSRGQIGKQKPEYKIQPREKELVFRQEKQKRRYKGGERKEEMVSKWLSRFFIVSPRNTLSSTGSSAQRFLEGKNKPVSKSFTNCSPE